MNRRTLVGLPVSLAAALLVIGCRDTVDPVAPNLAITVGSRPALDRFNGSLNQTGTVLAKGLEPDNPTLGSTLVVTFMWVGSANTITAVSDRLVDGTPVGNTYHLVEYVTADGISLATYVATNIQNFPYPNAHPANGDVLVVEAHLSEPTTNGGLVISTYGGVDPDFTQALGGHRSASGTGSSATTASAGPIDADAGTLVYGVSLSNGVVGVTEGNGFQPIAVLSDAVLKTDAVYDIRTDDGAAEPQWTWFYTEPHTWLATTLALKPAPGQTVIHNGTLGSSGSQLGQWLYPMNPNPGDAIIATFVWLGSTNVITSVTDKLSDGTPVGNEYSLVQYVTQGGISMATYLAPDVKHFPYPNVGENDVLVVEANLSEPVEDGGVMISAYSGVEKTLDKALGQYRSASGTGMELTTVDPGEIDVEAGALVNGVTLSNGVTGIEGPPDMTNIATLSDGFLKMDGAYLVSPAGSPSTARPQWTWYFYQESTWLASVLSLNPK